MTLDQLVDFAGRHPYLSLGFVGLTIAIVVNEVMQLFRGFHGASPQQVTDLMNRQSALVIDVSPLTDFEKAHIPGSRHVAMNQFDPESKLLAGVRELPVVVVCRAGQTSGDAARRLVKAGFRHVHVLEGGIAAWRAANYPVAKGRA
ncbi:rhodanese-like domain-containing protein [Coralloluteibacterium stylophorae]|uniref:Rhodanese-like domain-containing protein n=1 Tax=Coralloluteibacterium stylophorae TaxID=1776034 RepID=A0A8J7VSZ0_9GAMM|nr:rhodanese-like domain-containing protein [Coralloluteibacterium stylophorae]